MNKDSFRFWQKAYLVTLLLFLIALGVSVFALAMYSYDQTVDSAENGCRTEFLYIKKSFELDTEGNAEEELLQLANGYVQNYRESGVKLCILRGDEIIADSFVKLVNIPEAETLTHMNIGGNRHIVIVEKIGEDVTVIYGKDLSELDQAFVQMMISFIALYTVVSSLLAVILYFILKKLSAPLEALRKVTEDISCGKYTSRANESGNDEISALGKSFNVMLDTVNSQMNALKDSNTQKQELIDNLAHELRTPLTSIRGYAEYIEMASLTEEEQIEAADCIISQSERLRRISEKLLDIAVIRNTKINKKPIYAKSLIENAQKTISDKAKQQDVRLTTVCEYDDLKVFGDDILLDILVCNLCENAIKACNAGGWVELRARREKDSTVISVRDNGKGMTQEQLFHICEPFYRTDKAHSRKEGGTGLGLALCKQIAEAHGAKLDFCSKVGVGTEAKLIFYFIESRKEIVL